MNDPNEPMRWFWVRFHYAGDGYYTVDAWELVAATSAAAIVDAYASTYGEPTEIVPYDMVPVPKTPRRTVHPRRFDPTRQRP